MPYREPLYDMDGHFLGHIVHDKFSGDPIDQIEWRVRPAYTRDPIEIHILELDERWGALEGQEVVIDEWGDWLACFDLDVVAAFQASRTAMKEAAE